MKVSIVGAGPAGLYLGILLKKADPAHEIEIVERNAPDATFGWGVVFSGETLGALRDADLPTYIEITDTFARWDTVDIRYRGRLLRSRGHTFSGIARRQLLAILQRRCQEVGVKLEFGVEIDDPGSISGDLVVAADGVNSLFRRHHAEEFGSTVEPQGCKYVWFGTDLVLDAFRFIFTDTEYGLFQVHSYPFDESTSTFIVECAEPVWRRAGLDQMSEQDSLEFCQRLFAEDLGDHRLLSNRSVWLDFLRVSNRTWHHGNIVLLGDAAHTAHFSIGSGTKLAMEDAIALANACIRHTEVRTALVDYELERQAGVERVQRAADESAGFFSRVVHSTHMAPWQFAANLLTRSGRISHAGLAVRDPGFVQGLDAWFARSSGGSAEARFAPPPLFAPLEIGGTTVHNRVVLEARGMSMADAALAGAGLVTTGPVAVSAEGRISQDDAVLDDDARVEGWRSAVDGAHRAGALAMVRLGHAGRRGATEPRSRGVDVPMRDGGWPLIAASALPYGPSARTPTAMDADDMDRVRVAFAGAAARAADAGFDALELDAAHGYLLAGFLTPLANRREDGYGGSFENRLRFPLEVLAAVRDAWPAERLLAVRLSITDWARGGVAADEGIEIARAMAAAGAHLIHVEAGQTIAGGVPEYRRGYLTTLSDRVRNEARVPTLVGGYLTTLDEINTAVVTGRADLCLLESVGGDADEVAR
ncbi:MAG TPA: FAD-dependent monooxygenase [Jiangellales bacterium]|nr:FAD-dependent monooxygenase [Jiangellales bacterium]